MSKRGANEGSIHQRKDGRWCASVHLGYEGGKRKRKHFLGHSRKEVQEKLNEALAKMSQGLPIATKRQSVAQYLDDWLQNAMQLAVRVRTFDSYESVIRLYIKPEIGNVQLADLAPQHVQKMLMQSAKKGLSPTTVRYHRTVLIAALNTAVKWGLIARNPASLVPTPKVEEKEVRPLSVDEARTLLTVLTGDPMEALFTVAISVGLRLGEALGLQWGDIDFDQHSVAIRRQVQRLRGTLRFSEPKTKRSRRTIVLPAGTIEALRDHRIRQFQQRMIAGDGWRWTSCFRPAEARRTTNATSAAISTWFWRTPVCREFTRMPCATPQRPYFWLKGFTRERSWRY